MIPANSLTAGPTTWRDGDIDTECIDLSWSSFSHRVRRTRSLRFVACEDYVYVTQLLLLPLDRDSDVILA